MREGSEPLAMVGEKRILLGFAPFLVFVFFDRLAGSIAGLLTAALFCAVLILRDWRRHGHRPKMLEIGSVLLFAGLALRILLGGPDASPDRVRLQVDLGLFAIICGSLLIGRPFTLQYAREQVARTYWKRPAFARTNLVVAAVWALAFAVMVLADLLVVLRPDLSEVAPDLVALVALFSAARVTSWYRRRYRWALVD